MKISATSTLVLNWTDSQIWDCIETKNYNNKIDLTEGKDLFKLFSKEENFMHTQTISGRKYFIKKCLLNFLAKKDNQGKSAQVLVLAAGLAPLSVEIASLKPACKVFDIDQYLMDQKKTLINDQPANIEFIECDITDLNLLSAKLLKQNFNFDKPSIAVMEGIIYYLPKKHFKNILHFLKKNNMAFVCDFCLKPKFVDEKTKFYLTNVFRKIKDEVLLDFINFYSEKEITDLLKEVGYKKINVVNMQQIQIERTGKVSPFLKKNFSWVMNVFAE